jgi:ABC-type multidrug transport system fused ATPase/permease subunit
MWAERERERERKRTEEEKKTNEFLNFFFQNLSALSWLFFRFCFFIVSFFFLYLVLGDVIFVSNHQTLRRRRRS